TSAPPTALFTLSLHDALPIFAGEPPGPAGVGPPVADVDGPVRPGHHLARAEQRVVGLDEFQLVRDRERRPGRLDLVGADQFAERSEEHTSELQSLAYLVCRLL